MLKKEPYATFTFTTIDPDTTEQTPVEFFNGCKQMLSKPRWWVVTIVFIMESNHLFSEHTLVFSTDEKVFMGKFAVTINHVLLNHCLLPGFRFVEGRASCAIRDKPYKPTSIVDEDNYDLLLYCYGDRFKSTSS